MAVEGVDGVALLAGHEVAPGVLHRVAALGRDLVAPPHRHRLAPPREAAVSVAGVLAAELSTNLRERHV